MLCKYLFSLKVFPTLSTQNLFFFLLFFPHPEKIFKIIFLWITIENSNDKLTIFLLYNFINILQYNFLHDENSNIIFPLFSSFSNFWRRIHQMNQRWQYQRQHIEEHIEDISIPTSNATYQYHKVYIILSSSLRFSHFTSHINPNRTRTTHTIHKIRI